MIYLRNLTIGYGEHVLFRDISADFLSGQLIALLGRNGTGKSTLLHTIAGLHKSQHGEILFGDRMQSAMNPVERSRYVSVVTTERIRLPFFKCRDLVALGRSPYTNWWGREKKSDKVIVEQALYSVGMINYAERTMDTMSDGECQRIMIARALAQDTPAILLDEPTSFLDMPNRYELGLLLRKFAHEYNKCIIFSTHELDIAINLCDSIVLIENPLIHFDVVDKIVESGCLERLFQNDTIGFDAHTQHMVLK